MGTIFAFFSPGPMEMIIIGAIAVLLFGKRLPEVGRSLGKGIVEFKKGIHGIEDEIGSAMNSADEGLTDGGTSHEELVEADREEATAPKFEPPAHEPQAETVES